MRVAGSNQNACHAASTPVCPPPFRRTTQLMRFPPRQEEAGSLPCSLSPQDKGAPPDPRRGKRSTALLGTARAKPPAIALLIPITRPCASANGPPELPGASRTSACTHLVNASLGPIAWIIPLSKHRHDQEDYPPQALVRQPVEHQSPTVAALRSAAETVSAAKLAVGSAWPHASNTSIRQLNLSTRPRTTWLLVIIKPLECQITPDPTPNLRLRTCTVERLNAAATAANSSVAVVASFGVIAILFSPPDRSPTRTLQSTRHHA